MKIILISDTHSQHGTLNLPEGDMIIHAGDVSGRGTRNEILDFLVWYSSLSYKYKIFIAGNHDYYFENRSIEMIKEDLPENLIYLNDNEIIIEEIRIWGSPVQPYFHNWAFNKTRGAEIKVHWDMIPEGIDILITHGPAHKVLDKVSRGSYVGCEDLLQKVKEVKPKYHICGHIHEAYGKLETKDTIFYNASVLNEDYQLVNEPFTIYI